MCNACLKTTATRYECVSCSTEPFYITDYSSCYAYRSFFIANPSNNVSLASLPELLPHVDFYFQERQEEIKRQAGRTRKSQAIHSKKTSGFGVHGGKKPLA